MVSKWINLRGNDCLIIFFNGWGMDENVLSQMNHTGYDVLVFYNYSSFSFSMPSIGSYKTIYLVAWSMGVYAAEASGIVPDVAIAINGTSLPVDDVCGINRKTVLSTMDNWCELSRNKFNGRMMGGAALLQQAGMLLPNRSVEDQKSELSSIVGSAQEFVPSMRWDKAIVGQRDLIFLPSNQWNYWKDKTMVKEVDIPHWPFTYFVDWDSILKL